MCLLKPEMPNKEKAQISSRRHGTWTGGCLEPVQASLRASWAAETIPALVWWLSSRENRKDGPEQWDSVASPPFPSAVASAIRVPATNSLPACDLLFPVCDLGNQMTRAVRTVCQWRAECWEIDRDHLLQESRQQASWQPFLLRAFLTQFRA